MHRLSSRSERRQSEAEKGQTVGERLPCNTGTYSITATLMGHSDHPIDGLLATVFKVARQSANLSAGQAAKAGGDVDGGVACTDGEAKHVAKDDDLFAWRNKGKACRQYWVVSLLPFAQSTYRGSNRRS